MRCVVPATLLLLLGTTAFAEDKKTAPCGWRALPLADCGKVHKNWSHVGWGSFVCDNDALRTECDDRGMGLQKRKTAQ